MVFAPLNGLVEIYIRFSPSSYDVHVHTHGRPDAVMSVALPDYSVPPFVNNNQADSVRRLTGPPVVLGTCVVIFPTKAKGQKVPCNVECYTGTRSENNSRRRENEKRDKD